MGAHSGGEPLSNKASQAAVISLCVTALVVVLKISIGTISGSVSVLAEGLQSLVDVLISMGVIYAIRIAARPPDEDHPYGHSKAEVLMSAMQMVLLVLTAGFVISQAVDRLIHRAPVDSGPAAIAMGCSAAIVGVMSLYIARVAKQTGSKALEGEVLHLRSDGLAALGIFIGLIIVYVTKWEALDPIIAILFTLIIVVSALRNLRKLLHLLMDGALEPSDLKLIDEVLKTHAQVRGFHNVRTRSSGSDRYVDLHVLLDDDLTFVHAHDLAEEIEAEIRDALGGAWVTVHYEPYEHELKHRQIAHGEA